MLKVKPNGKTVLKISGSKDTSKFKKFLNKMESDSKLKEMSFREMAAVYLSEVDENEND